MPLRMHHAAMSRTDIRPIPSVPSSNRPYSVPAYLDHTRSEDYDNIAYPERSATSSAIDDIDKLVPPRQPPFLQRVVAENNEHDPKLPLLTAALEETAETDTPLANKRRVAKRGSMKSASNNTAWESVQTEQGELTESLRRATGHTAVESNPPKRVKINVVRSQSRTASKAYHTRSSISGKQNINYFEEDDNYSTVAGSSDDDLEIANTVQTPKKSRYFGAAGTAKPDPYDIMGTASGVESPRNARKADKPHEAIVARGAGASDDRPGTSNATVQNLDVSSQYRVNSHLEDNNTSAQYNMVSRAISSLTGPKFVTEGRGSRQLPKRPSVESLTTPGTVTESESDNENLETRISRIEDVIGIQRERGLGEFVKGGLVAGGTNVLETLTNDLLLGMVVADDELLEQVGKIM